MLQLQLSGLSQGDFTSLTIEKTGLVTSLQLLNMLGDSRLADKQLLRSLRKT